MTAPSSLIAATTLVVVAAMLICISHPRPGTTEPHDARPPIASAELKRHPAAEASNPRFSEVLRLGKEDWRRNLDEERPDLAADARRDILELSAELDHSLSTGGDIDDPAAEVFAEAISILLGEDGSTTPSGSPVHSGF